LAPTFPNPTQQLDFRRFSSDELLSYYVAERDVLRRHSPTVPVTTNFMVMSHFKDADYRAWAPQMDVVSNDHYMRVESPDAHIELAFSADTTRGLASGDPWLLMETATSAVNWQPRNVPKQPGELIRNGLQHVARGADGVCFFQWRASRAGAEKFHSALVPHAGADSKIWREVVQLGATLDNLAEVAGSRVSADVAIVTDWHAWWACELDSHPSSDVSYLDRAHAIHRDLWQRGITADVVGPDAELSGYRLVVVPTLYLVTDDATQRLRDYVSGGGTALVTYFSGIVDESDHIRLGGYPGAYRDLLGLRVEEFFPLRSGETVTLDDGSHADVWTEMLHLGGADSVTSYVDGPVPGVPAITQNMFGAGTAWYLATRLDEAGTTRLVDRLLMQAGVEPPVSVVPGLEVVSRASETSRYVFLINHTTSDHPITIAGHELLTGETSTDVVTVPAGNVRVVRQSIS
jgi:beta-galactosidase